MIDVTELFLRVRVDNGINQTQQWNSAESLENEEVDE